MSGWIRHIFVIPLSLMAAVATIVWIALEIMGLTIWNLIRRASAASREFSDMLRGRKKSPLENPYIVVVLVVAAVGTVYLLSKKGKE